MNIVELSKAMEIGQTAYSRELKERVILKDYGLYVFEGEEKQNDIMLECNMNYLCTKDWEIDLPYVDFWTAYQAARNEGWAILWEGAESPVVYDNFLYISPDMINGRWQILNQ